MTDALSSWLLSIPYLLTGIGFLFIAWAAGGYAYALLAENRVRSEEPWFLGITGAGLFLLVIRVAAGLALISWISAIVGVSGLFRPGIMFALLLPIVVLGIPIAHRFAMRHKPMLLRDRMDVGYDWVNAARLEKAFAGLIVLVFCVLVVNTLIGALVPDMNQDPMWYHLSVAQQWVFAQRFEVYPDVMPSAYPLAVESLYAVIFLLNADPVLCSLLTGMSGALLLVGMTASATMAMTTARPGAMRGWGLGAVAGLWIPLISLYGMVAPVQPKNDVMVMLWTLCGAMPLLLPLLCSGGLPSMGWWMTGGFLLGTACSAKPSVLGITFFLLLFCVSRSGFLEWRISRKMPRQTARGALLCVVLMAAAMAPWMVRGYLAYGLPFFPLGQGLFTTSPDYEPLFRAFNSLHSFAEPTAGAWVQKFMDFPTRLSDAGTNGEKGIFLFILIVVVGLLQYRGRWRWFSGMLAAQMLLVVGMEGSMEVFRFFSPVYCLAAPLLAWVVADNAPRISRHGRFLLGGIVWVFMLASVGMHHHKIAVFKTMNWQFRPLLSDADVRFHASHAEKGEWFLNFSEVRNLIEDNERVLLLGSNYPFYLHRDTLWNDEAVKAGGLQDSWDKMGVEEAKRFLQRESIDVVLMTGGRAGAPLVGLVETGALTTATLPDTLRANGWAMHRVEQAKVFRP